MQNYQIRRLVRLYGLTPAQAATVALLLWGPGQ